MGTFPRLRFWKGMLIRFMRSILFFDLPNVTKKDQREYVHFLKLLKGKGFVMLQESVYTKLSLNETVVDATLRELKEGLPPDGLISMLTVTEKQFVSIVNLLGESSSDVITTEDKMITL